MFIQEICAAFHTKNRVKIFSQSLTRRQFFPRSQSYDRQLQRCEKLQHKSLMRYKTINLCPTLTSVL
jgi:hypothetical protein